MKRREWAGRCFLQVMLLVALSPLFLPQAAIGVNLTPSTMEQGFPGITGAKYTFTDGPFGFAITLSGPDISNTISGTGTESATHVFTGEFWQTNVTVTVNDNAIDDDISIGWISRHVKVPNDPTDHRLAEGWNRSFVRDGEENTGTTSADTLTDHNPHRNKYTSLLNTSVVTTNFPPFFDSDSITSWGWSFIGIHEFLPIPEPEAWTLLCLGMLFLAGLKMRSKARRHIEAQ
jgi:hypothetical protein